MWRVELADQISKDDCAAVVINNFRAWKLNICGRRPANVTIH